MVVNDTWSERHSAGENGVFREREKTSRAELIILNPTETKLDVMVTTEESEAKADVGSNEWPLRKLSGRISNVAHQARQPVTRWLNQSQPYLQLLHLA